MDLKHFKKVDEDDNCTTLRHYAGHELKVAHRKLSSKMREKLQALPMAKGGKVDKQPMGKEATAKIQDDTKKVRSLKDQMVKDLQVSDDKPRKKYAMGEEVDQDPVVAPGAAQAMSPEAPQEPMPADAAEATAPQEAAAPPVSEQMNPTPQPDVATGEYPPPQASSSQVGADSVYQNTLSHLNDETKAMEHDFADGHIKPMTYKDLYGKKDTSGKIGTLFGLLVAGAGSGLTHQTNAVMDMMDKEIDRDMKAQQESQGNKQNFLKIAQQNEMNKAGVNKLNAETSATAFAKATAAHSMATFHDLVERTNAMPEGMAKENAKKVLAQVYTGMQGKIANANDAAAGAAAQAQLLYGSPSGGNAGGGEDSFQQRQKGLLIQGGEKGREISDYETSRHVPGIPGQASKPLTEADRSKITDGKQFGEKLKRFQEWTKSHSGDLNPSDMKTGQVMAAELQGAYRAATNGGVYKEGEQNFISKIIDSNPTKFFNSIRVSPQLEALSKEHEHRMGTILNSYGFKAPASSSGGGGHKDGDVMKSKSGKDLVFGNGQWNYK